MANEQIKARGNGAQNDKDSILVEAKKLLAVLHAALPNIHKVHRQLSAYSHMVHAALTLIEEFHLAREYKEDRVLHQKRMIAQYAVISAMLEECDSLGYITKSDELKICQILDRMDEGIRRWKSATMSPKNQEREEVIRNGYPAPDRVSRQVLFG